MNLSDKIYIAGHTGMLGSALHRMLQQKGYANIVGYSSNELDLTNQQAVGQFFRQESPDIVFLAAARVGGIQANITRPAEFIYDNLMIQSNVIHQAWKSGVKKFIFFGSSCVYPKHTAQPMKEEQLLSGKLEPTNEGYALAKIAGMKMLEMYQKQYGMNVLSVMPCNLYGPNDSFDPHHSHVLSALVKKFVDAVDSRLEEVTLWGTGAARRELMHVDDCVAATLFLNEHYKGNDFLNIGWGEDVSIKELATLIAEKTAYTGKINWDTTKPDGMMRKCMDVSTMKKIGFQPQITLEEGVDDMIRIYKTTKEHTTQQI